MNAPVPVRMGDGIAGRERPGDGETILWLHGYTMDSSLWTPLWALLPDWYHIGIDLPGHGASRPLDPVEDLSSLAERLCDLAREHYVRHLIALSFGTILALQMAMQRPSAFASLVLAAPALAGGPRDLDIEARYEELTRLYIRRGPGSHLTALWMRSPPDIFKGAEQQPQLWNQLATVIGRHAWAELGSGAMYALTSRVQTEVDLRTITAATLILLGEAELSAFKHCARVICRSLRACSQASLPGVGHLCLLEAPAASCALISAHLDNCGADS